MSTGLLIVIYYYRGDTSKYLQFHRKFVMMLTKVDKIRHSGVREREKIPASEYAPFANNKQEIFRTEPGKGST
jgi:hypothetical protein